MPTKKGTTKKGGKKEDAEIESEAPLPPPVAAPAVMEYNAPLREVVKPPNQLDLGEEEFNEEIPKLLQAKNPLAPKNIQRYNFSERSYKPIALVDQLVVHYAHDGILLHKNGEEAKQQIEMRKLEKKEEAKYKEATSGSKEDGSLVSDSKTLRNHFNFVESAAQTQNNAMRDRTTSTEPPQTASYNAQVTQWKIYDSYLGERENARALEAARSKEVQTQTKEATTSNSTDEFTSNPNMARLSTVMERMVNQISFDDIAQDFKYWEDVSDQYRESEGTLLPLWKFYPEKGRRKHVTSLCWNPQYLDMFAVGYGSFDFMRQTNGLICCYSLKNPSHPEYTFTTNCGVMCLDFNRQQPNLLAVGLYDGSVLIYDIRIKGNKPIFESTVRNGKHMDAVWSVKWQEEDLSKAPTFFSVSSDGRVTLWTMNKTELTCKDVTELKPSEIIDDEGIEAAIGSLSSGCSFDFNNMSDHLFVVGTEEGSLHKCSKLYSSQYLTTYDGHNMGVYSVHWNQLHPKVFLSCSADWTIKIWDHNITKPLMTFDLNNAVGDAVWSPYSSSIFAAATGDGKVFVYDLNENKHEPLCEQKIVRKAKLTKLAFNPKLPVLLVGDDRGCVTSLKLSPNLLRKSPDGAEGEVEKMNKILEVALKL